MKLNQITPIAMLLALMSTMVFSQESTPIAQINGQDVALPADTVVDPINYGGDLKGLLLDSGINFILISNRSDGKAETVTVFASEDVERVCGFETALTKDISIVFNGTDQICSE